MGVQLDSGGKKKGVAPNINVTPLVDVVLVLLIIFMVVLPDMSDSGKKIDMVKVAKADKPEGELVTVTIDSKEAYSLGDVDLEREAVLAGLRTSFEADSRQPVLLRADAQLPYRVVREFFAEIQEIGFENIALAVGVSREWAEEGEG
jgi:biopolymer transport protein ExbD